MEESKDLARDGETIEVVIGHLEGGREIITAAAIRATGEFHLRVYGIEIDRIVSRSEYSAELNRLADPGEAFPSKA